MADTNNDDVLWDQAVQQQESANDPNAVSSKGAVGLMQTLPSTARDPGYGVTPAKNDSPAELQRVGQDYRKAMFQKYGDPALGLIAYNYGPDNTDKWLDNGGKYEDLPKETQNYLATVHGNFQNLKAANSSQNTQTVQETTPAAYTTTVQGSGDPIFDALSAQLDEKNLPIAHSRTDASDNLDPIAKALSENTDEKSKLSGSKAPNGSSGELPWYAKPAEEVISGEAGFGQGMRDVGAGVQKMLGGSTLGGVLDSPEQYAAKKSLYEKTWGSPAAANALAGGEVGRTAGQLVGTMPALAAGGEVIGGAGTALSKAYPALETPINALTGNLASNAKTNAAGQTIKAATLGNKAARLASTIPAGALTGGAFNALTGESPVQGAEVGAALGPAAKLVGDTGAATYNKITGNGGALSPALQKILQRAKSDNLAPEEITLALQKLGENATIGDLGPNLRGLQTSVLQVPGPGMGIVKDALESRNAGQADRLKNLAVSGLKTDPTATYASTEANLTNQQKTLAAPIYKDAYAANQSVASPEISRILKTPAGKSAMKDAVTTMQNSRELVGVSSPDLVEQAALTGAEPTGDGIAAGLKLKTLDQVKQSLWDLGEAAKGKFGEATTQSRAIHQLRSDLTDELDQADATAVKDKNGNVLSPGKYAQARATFADPAQAKDALDSGYEFMKSGAESNTGLLQNMSDAQKPFFRVGAANWLKDTLHGSPDGANAVNRIFGSPAKRDAIKSIFPSEQEFNAFEQELDKEKKFAETYGYSKNSLTTPYALSVDDLARQPTKMGKFLTSASNVVPSMASVGSSLAFHSPWPVAADVGVRGGRAIYTKLTTPTPISGAISEELGHTMANPFGAKSSLAKLTPSKVPATSRNPLIDWYMQHLGVPGAIATGNNLTSSNVVTP